MFIHLIILSILFLFTLGVLWNIFLSYLVYHMCRLDSYGWKKHWYYEICTLFQYKETLLPVEKLPSKKGTVLRPSCIYNRNLILYLERRSLSKRALGEICPKTLTGTMYQNNNVQDFFLWKCESFQMSSIYAVIPFNLSVHPSTEHGRQVSCRAGVLPMLDAVWDGVLWSCRLETAL